MSNDKIVLIGGGGHCKSVLDTVIRAKKFSEVVITDYNIPAGTMILGCRVVGNDDILQELFTEGFKNAFITIGSIQSTDRRRNAFLRTEKIGFSFPSIIDQSAVIANSASIAPGVFIGKNAVVNTDAVIEKMAVINTGAVVEHDCRIGEFTHIAVGAVICGGAKVEKDVFVGANSTIIQGVKIGMKSIIGAGSTIIGDVSENDKAVGIRGGYCRRRQLICFESFLCDNIYRKCAA